jgi:hypothetical protein
MEQQQARQAKMNAVGMNTGSVMKGALAPAMGGNGRKEQEGENQEEEAIREMRVEVGEKHSRPPVDTPQEHAILPVGLPQEKSGPAP